MIRSRMAWVRVASPIRRRQRSTGIWLVISVAPRRNVLRRFPTCRGVLRPERLETPIVEHQELDAGEGAHQTRVATVAARQRKIAEHTRDALIEHRAVVATALWPRAQASQLLPTPAGPSMIRFCVCSIQRPAIKVWKSARSRPRVAR